jgi:hypothetical protein
VSITEPLFELADVGEPQVDRRGVDVLEQALAAADDPPA